MVVVNYGRIQMVVVVDVDGVVYVQMDWDGCR